MGLALNLIALVMVIGLSWFAMLWMSSRSHGERRDASAQSFGTDHFGEDEHADLVEASFHDGRDCSTCSGSGARKNQGRLAPCPVCEGTGILG